MQFLILAYDGKDKNALDRRMKARSDHIGMSDEAIKRGEQITGAALLNDDGNMIGSAMVVEFESRADVDEWLKNEPYVTQDVWEDVQIIPCRIGPSFTNV